VALALAVAVAVVVSWQPSPARVQRFSGTVVSPPAPVSDAWVASQRAWVDLAVNQPVELSGTDAQGGCPQARVIMMSLHFPMYHCPTTTAYAYP
jgi:hypothetical protein